MPFLLDTNACIALINGQHTVLHRRIEKALQRDEPVYVSSVVLFELWYGVGNSAHVEFNTRRLRAFLSGPLHMLAFDDEDAKSAGLIRADLEARGKPIGAYDLLIAGQAMNRSLTVVTANISEFSRVKGLSWQDWAEAGRGQ